MLRIGVFGGSFDPPHLGHRALVETALARLKLDQVWVVPVGKPVHRTLSTHVSPQQRLHLVQALFADTPNVQVMPWEVEQQKAVPSSDTLHMIQHDHPDISPIFLLGMDAWQGMPNWMNYPIHRQLCNIAVFTRTEIPACTWPEWEEITVQQWVETDMVNNYGHVVFVPDTLPDISATQIRHQITTNNIEQETEITMDIQQLYRNQ